MNKKNRRPKISKPNLPRSKNNPSGKRNDPDVDWPRYAEGRKSEGRNYVEWMGKIADFIRKLLDIPKGERDRRVSAVLVAILKSEEKLSYWGLVKHFAKHPGDLNRCELDRPYGKSWYHLRISQTDDFILHEIIGWMAGDAAVHGTKIVDSTGFSISRYRDWHNAKYGTISVKQFAKLHIVHALGGKICAAAVTPGKANDSPYLREMLTRMPRGSGDVLGDSQYGGVKNCQAVQDSGRRAVIDPRTDYKIEGEDARAEMLMFLEEHPGTFRKLLRKRNNVESVFSSMKERFGGVVRAVKAKTQTVELLSMCVCYNMTFA